MAFDHDDTTPPPAGPDATPADGPAEPGGSGDGADSGAATGSGTSKKTTKKTAKKTAKKTTKKVAKKAAKKTTKKVAKKAAKKKTTKKVTASEADADEASVDEADAPAEAAAERVAETETPATDADAPELEDAADAEPSAEPVAEAEAERVASDDDSDTDSGTEADAEADSRGGANKRPSRRSSKRESKPESKKEARKDAKPARSSRAKGPDTPPLATPEETKMLISYAPGEECRVAITERGKLTEFDAESFSKLSRVGNIYLGRVTNVEAGVQAAFVDFGGEEAGFLHVSDLHPQYFPGADSDETERVGKKTPRRERPLIQQALRKGQQVVVQVIKEGIGTKGPTVTSYLSIPGRFLVMMPNMDKVGVSRKVEDEDQRKAMRAILDQVELPEGFGFILRTAGMDRTKTELKRDLSYLQRLWKAMEKARSSGGKKPRLLYAESDLLVRSLRDQLSADIGEVVIDHDLALERAAKFMKIVAPRSSVKLTHYQGSAPMFHAFGVEEQVRLMHSNEVPLESGGRLVIDETEALVAIDVNSGRMRGARDAETNAFRVNLEAADEICRQLRLRDLGGLVINDLIDMREARHRKAIEQRFKDHLKRDRAKSTILPISQFGILEMTRQRMRGSQQSQHFVTCPSCSGRGLLKRPGTVVAEALRDLVALLDNQKVAKVEMVVSPRVAGTLLSERRGSLGRIERRIGKKVDVRVSEALPPDRVAFYAYDPNGADVDIEKLKKPKINAKTDLVAWDYAEDVSGEIDDFASDPEGEARRIAEREHAEAAAAAADEAVHHAAELAHPIEEDHPELDEDEGAESSEDKPKKKRRRRRRKRKGSEDGAGTEGSEGSAEGADETEAKAAASSEPAPDEGAEADAGEPQAEGAETDESDDEDRPKKKRRRRRRRRGKSGDGEGSSDEGRPDSEPGAEPGQGSEPEPKPKPRSKAAPKAEAEPAAEAEPPTVSTPERKRKRTLYAGSRRSLAPSEKSKIKTSGDR